MMTMVLLTQKVSSFVYWERWFPHPQWGCSITDNGCAARRRRRFRSSPETPELCLPLPQLSHNPVSDALKKRCPLYAVVPSLLPPSLLRPWAENKTFRVRVYCEYLLNSNHHHSPASSSSGYRHMDQPVAQNARGWPCLRVAGTATNSNTPHTDQSIGLIYQYNQQVYNYISISFSKYTALLMSLIEEKIKHSFIFIQQLFFDFLSLVYQNANQCTSSRH